MRRVLTALCVALALGRTAAAQTNVLLICVDDLKPLLGCYGDRRVRTPHIDRLAARGVVFERAYCNQAVCAPSRNALMTGLRPSTIGIYDLPTHFRLAVPEAVTVAQRFMRAGYRTEALGKIMHVGHGNVEDAPSWSVPVGLPAASRSVRSGSASWSAAPGALRAGEAAVPRTRRPASDCRCRRGTCAPAP